MTNEFESKVFEAYTWNGEVETSAVYIGMNKPESSLIRMTEGYLQSLGFKIEEEPEPFPSHKGFPKPNKPLPKGWRVDLVYKKVKKLSQIEFMIEKQHVAWPSQLPLFMKEFRGALSGKKFGV